MASSVDSAAQRRKLLGEIDTSGRDRCLRNPIGNLPHLRTSGLPLPRRRTQAWSASERELPWGEG